MISDNSNPLTMYFDCVVMLTASNWKTEPRSNRYHYASRFAKCLPVLFVQPDLQQPRFTIEKTEIDNVVIVHVYSRYGEQQNKLINRAILQSGFLSPLLWVYNPHFLHFITQRHSPLLIYHATEDHYSEDFPQKAYSLTDLTELLKRVDLLVAVSPEVLNSYVREDRYNGEAVLLPNGCDYDYWSSGPDELPLPDSKTKIMLYQGGLNWRLDWSLIDGIGRELPDWELWLCGSIAPDSVRDIQSLKSKNIKVIGYLEPDKLRGICRQVTLGVIPFKQIDLINISLPLKAFEYAACGLPVVSVPIRALEPYPECFEFARTPREFAEAIVKLGPARFDGTAIQSRLKVAAGQDYDIRFNELLGHIGRLMLHRPDPNPPKVLVLYDAYAINLGVIYDSLNTFLNFSRSPVFYTHAANNAKCNINITAFDVMIIHHTIRLPLASGLSQSFSRALPDFGGYKILFIQGEDDNIDVLKEPIESMGIHAVVKKLPDKTLKLIYPERPSGVIENFDVFLRESVVGRSQTVLLTAAIGMYSAGSNEVTKINCYPTANWNGISSIFSAVPLPAEIIERLPESMSIRVRKLVRSVALKISIALIPFPFVHRLVAGAYHLMLRTFHKMQKLKLEKR
jgi:glycosyltransferase involved in cell wall biosynthesis